MQSAVARTIQFLKKKSGLKALTGSNRTPCPGISHERYRKERIIHWDRVSSHKDDSRRIGAFYHGLIQHYYRCLIPKDLKILEIGCSHGDLLAELHPSFGVGIDLSGNMIRRAKNKYSHLHFIRADAHEFSIRGSFDIIILSDLINDLWDVQTVLENIKSMCHPGTRLIINFYNNLALSFCLSS